MVQGARVIGLLLLWLAVGFLFDAATLDVQDELIRQADPEAQARETSWVIRPALVTIGSCLAVSGAILLVRDPGPAAVPADAAGRPETDPPPRRCWRCQGAWPAGDEACPHCGATRLGGQR